jgi:hypothetical protein
LTTFQKKVSYISRRNVHIGPLVFKLVSVDDNNGEMSITGRSLAVTSAIRALFKRRFQQNMDDYRDDIAPISV